MNRRLDLALGDHQNHWPLAPFGIRHPHRRSLDHPRHRRHDAFQFQRGYPLAARLDHILQPVRDTQRAIQGHRPDIAGMQPTATPQRRRPGLVAKIVRRQPRRPRHDLTGCHAVMGDIGHIRIDDSQLYQRYRTPGGNPYRHRVAARLTGHHIGNGQHRAGFRHAIARMNVDPPRHRRPRQTFGQGRAADDHLPMRQIHRVRPRRIQDHGQHSRHAMRKGHTMLGNQVQQTPRFVPPRINLPHPQHDGDIGKAPAMHMKHRRQRHIDIIQLDAAAPRHRRKTRHHAQAVQHQLPMAKADPLGVARRTGGVKQRGAGGLGQVRKAKVCGLRQRLIRAGKALRQVGRAIGQQHQNHRPRDARQQGQQHGQKIDMHQNGIVLRMVDRVQDLFRRQTHIHRMQRGPQHRHGKEAFQIAVTVIIHHRHDRALAQSQLRQTRTQPQHPRAELGKGHLDLGAIGDLLPRRRPQSGVQQLADEQLIVHAPLPVPDVFQQSSRTSAATPIANYRAVSVLRCDCQSGSA